MKYLGLLVFVTIWFGFLGYMWINVPEFESFSVNDREYVRGQPDFEDGVRKARWIIGIMISVVLVPVSIVLIGSLFKSVRSNDVIIETEESIDKGDSAVSERRDDAGNRYKF